MGCVFQRSQQESCVTGATEREVDEVEARIHSLKTADESSLADSQRLLEELGKEFETSKQRFEKEKETMNQAILSLTFELTDHREYIQKNLAMMSARADILLKEVTLEDEEEEA